MMREENKLLDGLSVYDDELGQRVIEFLQQECYESENVTKLLDSVLEMSLDDISVQSTVDECFVAIRSFAGIPVSLMHLESPDEKSWREYAIRFFSKAVDVMDSDLQMSVDYDERHEDTYMLQENFLNASEANYAYAKSIIESELVQCFDVDSESDEVRSIFSNVVTPRYTRIKRIVIDGEVLESLDEAQEYINKCILDQWGTDTFSFYFGIQLILGDDKNIFEDITLDLDDIYDADYIYNPLINIILDYLYDADLHSIVDTPYSSTAVSSIDLSRYKEQEKNTLELDFLHEDIFEDMYALLSCYDYSFTMVIEGMEVEKQIDLLSAILFKTYKSDMDKLDYKIHIMQLELALDRKDMDKRLFVNTGRLETYLPEFISFHDKVPMVYLYLKNIVSNGYYFRKYAIDKMSAISKQEKEFEVCQRPEESLGRVAVMLKRVNDKRM